MSFKNGNHIVVGGEGDDDITVQSNGSNTHFVMGDEGRVVYTNNDANIVVASNSTVGGNDNIVIEGAGNHNTVIAGANDQGTDSVQINMQSGADSTDIVFGDNGSAIWFNSERTQIVSTDPSVGGTDDIDVANGDKTIIAGFGDDTVDTGTVGTHRVIGDNGTAVYNLSGALERIESIDHAHGGADSLNINGEVNHIIAGSGDDSVTVDSGTSQDAVIGDNGSINYTGAKGAETLTSLQSNLAETGGADTITLGNGVKDVIAGKGNDTVQTVAGSVGKRLVMGDEGRIDYDVNQVMTSAQTTSTDNTEGSDDIINLQGGSSSDENIIFGGIGNDNIDTSESTDVVMGDNGQLTWTNGILTRIQSTDTSSGGADDIDLGNGHKTVVAGFGNDSVDAAQGEHHVIGDNGSLDYDAAGNLDIMQSLPSASGGNVGGDDMVTLGNGHNRVITGVGNDTVTTANGIDHVISDNGQLDYDSGTGILRTATSVEDTLGGDDTVIMGNAAVGESKMVIAGIGADNITAGSGDHVVLGDHGTLTYQADGILQKATNLGTQGGNDTMNLNVGTSGENVVIAGAGADAVTTGNGVDYMLGDHGEFNFVNGIITTGLSSDTSEGGDDQFIAGNGNKLMIGGVGNDQITSGNGNNWVLGDNGGLSFTNGILQTISTSDTAAGTGGIDTINLGNGDNIAMAGTDGDTLNSGTGDSILMGDNGTVTFDATGKRVQVTSEMSTIGGDDSISALGGDNLVLGGVGNDNITTGAGADSIFGDNGQLDYLNGILNRTETTDTTSATGGADTIEAGDGNNTVFGGTDGDTITSGVGNSVLGGDNGFVQLNDAGNQRVEIRSELSALGGDDDITARGGNNLAFGSVGNDRIETADGDDVIFGDNGVALYNNGLPDVYTTTDVSFNTSGNDELIGGAGDDVIFGALGNELIYGNEGDDKILGDLVTANYNTDDADPLTFDRIFSKNSEIGGRDEMYGGADDDVLIGGANDDKAFGESGDDFVSGDGALAKFNGGNVVSVETTELFIGGDDEVGGGEGNDILFGGFGSDLFYGDLRDDVMVGEYARALVDSQADGFGDGLFVVRLGQGNLDLIANNQFNLYNFKLDGVGFTPLAKVSPLSSASLDSAQENVLFTNDGERSHFDSNVVQSDDGEVDGSFIDDLDDTASGGEEGDKCYNENGEEIACDEKPEESTEGEKPVEQDQTLEGEGTPTDGSGTQTPESGEANPNQPETEQPAEEDSEQNENGDVLAAVSAMAGWALATGNKSGNVKVAQSGFDKLSHQQRKMQRWDHEKQCFVEDDK